MNYWQIAAGAFGRNYGEDFLRFGMAFVGGERQIEAMGRVALGDRFILKRGLSEVIAVGQVVERGGRCQGALDKGWLRDFDGWDLPAYCFVEWHEPESPIPVAQLGVPALARGTISGVADARLQAWVERALQSYPVRPRLDVEPVPTHRVTDAEILGFLVGQGLRPGAADTLTTTFNHIRLLARYYYDYYGYRSRDGGHLDWSQVREHETRTFLIAPLLTALGWAEQQIKIELPVTGRGRVDVACFADRYTGRDEDLVLILESKSFSQGLDYAPDQARAYAAHFPNCRAIVVTNGYCYKAFLREGEGSYTAIPSAYVNLLDPRDRYPLDPDRVDGCLEMLRLLLPSSWRQPTPTGGAVRTGPAPRPKRQAAEGRSASRGGLTDKQQGYLGFFAALLEQLRERYRGISDTKQADTECHMLLPSGRGGFAYGFVFRPDDCFDVEVFIHGRDGVRNKNYFRKLQEDAAGIESVIAGAPEEHLTWEPLPLRKACRIAVYRPGCVIGATEEELQELRDWAVGMYGRFRRAFDDRIKGL